MSLVENGFWKGVQQGIITSGLNHLAHIVNIKTTLLYALQKADVSDKGIARLHENVDGLTEGYKVGNSPTFARRSICGYYRKWQCEFK